MRTTDQTVLGWLYILTEASGKASVAASDIAKRAHVSEEEVTSALQTLKVRGFASEREGAWCQADMVPR